MTARAALAALTLAACSPASDLSLDIRLPVDRSGFAALDHVNLTVTRKEVVLAQRTFSASAHSLSLSGVSYGSDTVVALAGLTAAGAVIAGGRSCPIDFEAHGGSAPLYFAPASYFLPTLGTPARRRVAPIAAALDEGPVVVAGGASGDGSTLFGDAELFTPGLGSFAAVDAKLGTARQRAQAISVPGVGVLVVGGVDAGGAAVASAELYSAANAQFLSLLDARIDARVGHRAVVLPSGRVFISGGSSSDGGDPLATTFVIYVLRDGSFQASVGPPLSVARREHAGVVASGIPVVFGGYGAGGAVLDSIEEVDPATSSAAAPVATLTYARAEATATLVSSGSSAGSILIVGGRGADQRARADAELFNPITRKTTLYPMSQERYGHSATLLADGRVLVAGGFDSQGDALSSVELFQPDVGFLTERSLGEARGNHAAVPLCDDTILFVGGADSAELYSPPDG
jgi:hypothetical protein